MAFFLLIFNSHKSSSDLILLPFLHRSCEPECAAALRGLKW
jgi:hypothetical protein